MQQPDGRTCGLSYAVSNAPSGIARAFGALGLPTKPWPPSLPATLSRYPSLIFRKCASAETMSRSARHVRDGRACNPRRACGLNFCEAEREGNRWTNFRSCFRGTRKLTPIYGKRGLGRGEVELTLMVQR